MERLLLCKANGRRWVYKAPGPQQGNQCLDRVSILHMRKLSLSKVKGVVQGYSERMSGRMPHQVCVNASQHTHSPSAVPDWKPVTNSRGEMGLLAGQGSWAKLYLLPVPGPVASALSNSHQWRILSICSLTANPRETFTSILQEKRGGAASRSAPNCLELGKLLPLWPCSSLPCSFVLGESPRLPRHGYSPGEGLEPRCK